ncbi:L,D-transpeptidase [Nocardia goodfellowii]|uniref:Lipoprotein-anchoring transpeptidase ErfK/SrfK n=1 Tax=Nocardia goodfellowii TaxID=882446 RepID=A0ABS4QAM7_9NOCA|nr:Ig-like domain-containing protein [Nocardia goodfellowii]MBP2188759.1 lipoprotein-anchoring transpeptidase ErfK/SrfK [Nocardia goodfellowii]
MKNRPVIRRPVGVLSLLLLLVVALVAGCSKDESGPAEAGGSVAKVTITPGDDSDDVNPTAPVSVSVSNGVLDQAALTNANGKQVKGEFSPDKRSYRITEPLGYAAAYTWSGTARGADNQPVPIEGGFRTVAPKATAGATFQIADGQEVGIGAPIILQFKGHISNKAEVEKAITVTTNPQTEGAWAWFPDDSGGSRLHWRPKNYWQPGTTVHVAAKLYGLDLGGGVYGDSDLTSDFTIGRSQIVKANAPSHRMQVVRDGQVVMDFPASYGEGNEPRNVTRSGIHVVSEKHELVKMSNPPFYTDIDERWAVRISNNGEFIHANPESSAAQGNSNVTNGCINLSTDNAHEYFVTALYGDPVEVTGTSIPLSAADGDIYDWTISWEQWKTMSAAQNNGKPAQISATPVAPAAPR